MRREPRRRHCLLPRVLFVISSKQVILAREAPCQLCGGGQIALGGRGRYPSVPAFRFPVWAIILENILLASHPPGVLGWGDHRVDDLS